MMMKKIALATVFAAMIGMSSASIAGDIPGIGGPASVEAEFVGAAGEPKGTANLTESENGVLIRLDLNGLPPGEHAIHIHETGDCSPVEREGQPLDAQSYFSNAGSHLNPADNQHGFMQEEGPHPGDLPNIFVGMDGTAEAHLFNGSIMLRSANGAAERTLLLDEDGAALVIHEGADDYESQPTGNTGDRIACAAITSE